MFKFQIGSRVILRNFDWDLIAPFEKRQIIIFGSNSRRKKLTFVLITVSSRAREKIWLSKYLSGKNKTFDGICRFCVSLRCIIATDKAYWKSSGLTRSREYTANDCRSSAVFASATRNNWLAKHLNLATFCFCFTQIQMFSHLRIY